MSPLQKHLRNTFLAGIFAAIPLAVTIFIVAYVERKTREPLRDFIGINIPFLGVVAAIVAIYLVGFVVSSIIGKFFLNLIDKLLLRVPVLKDLYQAWKQVTLTPGGKEGMFAKVVLIAAENERAKMLGFTSLDPLPGDPESVCVFVPNAPNPIQGRLYFVRRDCCSVLEGMTAEEAFKVILSTGNYVAPQIALPAA
jgi:uncharacterized membrane protein